MKKDYETFSNITGRNDGLADTIYTGMLVGISDFWQNQMIKVFHQQYRTLDEAYVKELGKIKSALETAMQDFEPIAKNGKYITQVTVKDLLDSYPVFATAVKDLQQTMIAETKRIKDNTGSDFALPVVGGFGSRVFYSSLNWASMDLEQVLGVIGLTRNNYLTYNANKFDSLIATIQNPNNNGGKAYPILNTDNTYGGSYRAITDYTKQEVEFIKERIMDGFYVAGYANILGWTQFFKANPSIKSVGFSSQGRNYEDKFYAVELTDKYPSNVPKGIESYASVWDNSIWSSVFTEKEFNLLKQDGMDKLKNILNSQIAEAKRMEKKIERLQDSVQEETNKAFLNGIKVVLSDYPNYNGVSMKSQLMQIYYDAIGVNMQGGYYNFNVEVDEYSIVQYGYGGQEAKIIKATTIPINNNNIRKRCQSDNDFKEEVIKLIPQKVKADAKENYSAIMKSQIKMAKAEVQTAEQKLLDTQNKYISQLKLF